MSLLPIMIWLNIPLSFCKPVRGTGSGHYAVARSMREKSRDFRAVFWRCCCGRRSIAGQTGKRGLCVPR
jgi:hypothetical protein